MAYFELSDIKADLKIAGTTEDDQINNNWGPKADKMVDDQIYTEASKKRIVEYLPYLPLQDTDLTDSVRNAANHYVKQFYYLSTRNPEMATAEKKEAELQIDMFMKRLRVDSVFYGRVVR